MSNFLSIVWFKIYPPVFGGQKGTALFNKYLSYHYPVDCLCSSANKEEQNAGAMIIPILPPGKLQFINPFTWQKIKAYFRKKNYTHVIVEYPYYGYAGALLKKRGAIYILHTHNIEALRFRNLGKWWWSLLCTYEKWSMKQADLILFKTREDQYSAQSLYQISPEKCYVLPYGVEKKGPFNKEEARSFLERTYCISQEEKIILFAGTLDYQPNAEAVFAIYNNLGPLLSKSLDKPFKILITGRNKYPRFQYLNKLKNDQIIQTGFVEDIAIHFKGADLFISPVQNAHGIQTKILEAISHNCPVVAFEASRKGLPSYLLNKMLFTAVNGNYIDFADKVAKSFLSEYSTPECFFDDYGWQKNLEKLIYHMSKMKLL